MFTRRMVKDAKCHSCGLSIMDADIEPGFLAMNLVCKTGILTGRLPMFICMECFNAVFPPNSRDTKKKEDEKNGSTEESKVVENDESEVAVASPRRKSKKKNKKKKENEINDDPELVEEIVE